MCFLSVFLLSIASQEPDLPVPQPGPAPPAGGIRLVNKSSGLTEVYNDAVLLGLISAFPNPISGEYSFSAMCRHTGHKKCTRLYSSNTFPGQQALIDWLVDGGPLSDRAEHMKLPRARRLA